MTKQGMTIGVIAIVFTLFILGAPSLRYKTIIGAIDAAKGAGVDRVGIITEAMRKR